MTTRPAEGPAMPSARVYLAEFAGTFAWVFVCATAVIADATAVTLVGRKETPCPPPSST